MLGRCIGELRCSSSSNANTVRTAVVGLVAKTQAPSSFEQRAAVVAQEAPDWWVRFDYSYTSAASASALRDDVVSAWTSGAQANRILVGSRVSFHECHHDEGVGACVAVGAVK